MEVEDGNIFDIIPNNSPIQFLYVICIDLVAAKPNVILFLLVLIIINYTDLIYPWTANNPTQHKAFNKALIITIIFLVREVAMLVHSWFLKYIGWSKRKISV